MTDSASEARTERAASRPLASIGWLVIVAVVLLLSAFDTWTAVQNLITVPPIITRNYDFYREHQLDGLIRPVPWVRLVLAVIAPAAGLAGALLLGRRTALWRRIVLLAVAFCAVSAITASVSASISSSFGL